LTTHVRYTASMDWKEYRSAWRKSACAGALGRAQAVSGILALVFAPMGIWWRPLGDAMSWLPTLAFAVALVGLLVYGFLRAPHRLHQEVEKERDDLQEELTRANRIESVLVELGRLRRSGTSLRNDLAGKDVLDQSDKKQLNDWAVQTVEKIKEISPTQAEIFGTLDLIHIVVPDYIARHSLLVHHTERLARLKEFIDRYDAMLMGSRGLGKREA
jgi:hypothetical protein